MRCLTVTLTLIGVVWWAGMFVVALLLINFAWICIRIRLDKYKLQQQV